MISNSLRDKDLAYALHPYTNLRAHERKGPLVMTRGQGVRVFDEQGKAYIDAMAGLWCASLGFSEPRLAQAAERQMARLPFYHQFSHKAHDVGIELAEKLVGLAPVPMSKVLFANSGSESSPLIRPSNWSGISIMPWADRKKRKSLHAGVPIMV